MKRCVTRMSDLSADVTTDESGSIVLEIPWVDYLKAQGYRVEGINNVQTVDSGSRDLTHIVAQIETYDKPFGDDSLDLVEDETTVPVCSCENFTYEQGAEVEDSMITPSQSSTCKHLRKAFKAIQAREDESQTELGK